MLDITESVNGIPTKWVSPMVVVPKGLDDVRKCLDMRQANTAIICERHPISTIDEVFYELNECTVFSKLDMKWGFHQIKLDEESRGITTFTTNRGLYQYKCLMYGVASAQRSTRRSYMTHWQEIRVRQILPMIASLVASEWRITIRISLEHWMNWAQLASRWAARSVNFACQDLLSLGKISAWEAWLPTRERLQVSWMPGHQRRQLRSGHLSVWCSILRRTQKNLKFRWGVKQQEAFAKLKEMITERRTLAYIKNDCRTRIVADAGSHGLEAVLTQQQDGVWCGVLYVSRSLTKVERRYSQTQKEALALVWACERFNIYV